MPSSLNIDIESIGVYLPPKVVSTRETLNACKNKISFPIEDLTGIERAHMAGDDEFSIDLAKKAVIDCLAHSRYQPHEIDLLICSNISRCDGAGFHYSFEPSTAVRLKECFGFDRAVVFDISNACPGMFTAIKVVESFIKAGAINTGMVVSGDYITHLTRTAQRELTGLRDPRLACLTLGDSGAAVILEPAPNGAVGFHRIQMYTVGSYSDLCVAKVTDQEHGGAIMYTQAAKLAPAAVAQAIAHSLEMVRESGWTLDAVRYLIPHQTSRKTLRDMSDGLNELIGRPGWAESITIDNLKERGNTATTSHFVAVMDSIRKGILHSGDNVVFSIAGSGLTVGTALFTFGDLPDRLRQQTRAPSRGAASHHQPNKSPAPSRNATGVKIRSVGAVPAGWSGPRETVPMAKVAIERCLSRTPVVPEDVGLLLFSGVYRTDFVYEPAIAAMIAGALGLNTQVESQHDKKTLAFDISNGGLGFLNACHVATQMIRSDCSEFAIVVASEVDNYRAGCSEQLRAPAETGAAVMLSDANNGNVGFGDFFFHYNTEYLADFETHCAQENGRSFIGIGAMGALEDHYLNCIPEAVDRLLERAKLDLAQVRWILAPQRSSAFISRLSQVMQLDREKFIDVTRPDKDLFTSSLPYAFQHAVDNRMLDPGDICLLIDVGSGIQVGCAIYYC